MIIFGKFEKRAKICKTAPSTSHQSRQVTLDHARSHRVTPGHGRSHSGHAGSRQVRRGHSGVNEPMPEAQPPQPLPGLLRQLRHPPLELWMGGGGGLGANPPSQLGSVRLMTPSRGHHRVGMALIVTGITK